MKSAIKTVVAAAILASQFLPAVVQAQDQKTASPALPVLVAAGSLRVAFEEIMLAYKAQGGVPFTVRYGPSGKLREEIEAGAKVDVFASAALEHTDALAQKNLLGPSQVFAHNDLCVVARPQLGLRADNMLAVLAQPSTRLATSTPVSDPMGDYTWQFFKNADRDQPGIYQLLDAKALKLSGASAPAAGAKLPYVTAFEEDRADAYIMYCTNAVTTSKTLSLLQVVRIPAAWNVRSVYGIAAAAESVEGMRLVGFIRSQPGQEILRRHGFD